MKRTKKKTDIFFVYILNTRIVLKKDPYGFWAIDKPFPEVNVCGDFWCGPEGQSQAKTGLEEEPGGYWYVYEDPQHHASKWIFVGLGFNIVNGDQAATDVSEWGGLCLIYSSTSDFVVELGIENEAQVTEGCNPVLDVRKSDSLTMVKLPWSKLYASCGRGDLHDMSGLLQTVAAIKLKFTKSSDLLLRAVGSLEECKIRN